MKYPKERISVKDTKKYRNYEWLYKEYIEKDRSTQDIADEIGCKRNTVQCWLISFNIKKENVKRERRRELKPYETYEFLYKEHIEKRKTITQIAKENNVSDDAIIYNLKKNNIEYWVKAPDSKIKDHKEEVIYWYTIEKMSANQIGLLLGAGHTNVIKLLQSWGIETRNAQEAQFNLNNKEIPKEFNDKEWLRKKHWEENLTCAEIGGLLNVNASTIMRQMDRLRVKRKNNSESKKGLRVGPNHPNWKGGLSPFKALLREFFQTNLAPLAAKRDKYTCQLCGKTHTVLHVHHKKPFSQIVDEIIAEHPELKMDNLFDRFKMYQIITTDPRFLDLDNLITYCKECHFYKIHNFKKKNKD